MSSKDCCCFCKLNCNNVIISLNLNQTTVIAQWHSGLWLARWISHLEVGGSSQVSATVLKGPVEKGRK